ncbi:DUF3391 domain-containing protein, partial [Methylophaga sp. UBA5088]
MIKRINSSELRIGMYIQKLGGSWIQHPFIRSSFLITDPNDIKRIHDAGIKELWIDTDKGDNTSAPATVENTVEQKASKDAVEE